MRLLTIAILFLLCGNSFRQKGELKQRHRHNFKLALTESGTLSYSITSDGEEIVGPSVLGVNLAGLGLDFIKDLKLIQKSSKAIDEVYKLPTGKRSQYHDQCEEITYTYANNKNNKLNIVVRIYSDGVAFRYEFIGKGDVTVLEERTGYDFVENAVTWMMDYNPNYENFYPKRQLDTIGTKELSFPALFKTKNTWMLLTEASVYDQPATHLRKVGAQQLKIVSPEKQFTVQGTWRSPWRVFIMGHHLSAIVESVMVENLNPPSSIKDMSWIDPGVAVFPWWGDYLANSYIDTLKMYVDLAHEMKWEWIEFDVSLVGSPWRTSKLWETTEWLPDFTAYAKSKGIKVYGWDEINVLKTDEGREHVYGKYHKLGMQGIKIDYIDTDKAYAMIFRDEALRDAAKYKFMVSFHGETAPRGQRRKWPNTMTLEGVRGAEYYTFKGARPPDPQHNCTLPFTRNVVGPMDYTPVTFTIRKENPRVTTYAHELALPIIFESGWTCMADRPEAYLNSPAKDMLRKIETSWDETKFIDGYPGEFVCVARRKGSQWYLAAINAGEARTLNIPLDFLRKGKYEITVYEDKPGEELKNVNIRKIVIEGKSNFKVNLLKNGGFSTIITLRK